MIWIEDGPAGAEPVGPGEAKAWLRLDGAAEDGVVALLVSAAREMVEAHTGLILRRGMFRVAFEPEAGARVLRLSRRPARRVTGARAFDAAGVTRDVPAEGFAVRDEACRQRIELPEGFAEAARNGAELDVEAGMEPAEVPAPVRLAMLRLVAAGFELRGAVAAEHLPGVMPAHVRGLLAPWRRVGL